MNETEREQKYLELLAEKLNNDSPPFDFSGNNCADAWDEGISCNGWDGESRRCQCGNRRVSWVLSDDGTYIYAEAW